MLLYIYAFIQSHDLSFTMFIETLPQLINHHMNKLLNALFLFLKKFDECVTVLGQALKMHVAA